MCSVREHLVFHSRLSEGMWLFFILALVTIILHTSVSSSPFSFSQIYFFFYSFFHSFSSFSFPFIPVFSAFFFSFFSFCPGYSLFFTFLSFRSFPLLSFLSFLPFHPFSLTSFLSFLSFLFIPFRCSLYFFLGPSLFIPFFFGGALPFLLISLPFASFSLSVHLFSYFFFTNFIFISLCSFPCISCPSQPHPQAFVASFRDSKGPWERRCSYIYSYSLFHSSVH